MKKHFLTYASTLAIALPALLAAVPAQSETVRVGFMVTLSGPGSIIGKTMKKGFELGMEHIGGKLGGFDTEIFYEDDKRKPALAKQLANKLMKKNKVQFITGIIWSNLMMAIHKQVTKTTFLISSNAGPSPIAGKGCSPNFFSMSWQNDQTPEAMGKYLQDAGVKSLYLMAPNYQAGKDMLAGVERYYKGKILGKVFTKLGQKDFQAELSKLRAAKPEATFIFQPGGMGIAFVKQYAQAGLKKTIPLYNVFSVDAITLPAQKEAALGILGTQSWSPDLKNPVNQKFVSAYRAKHKGQTPAFYTAQSYDTVLFLDAAIRAAGGVSDQKKLREAMRTVKFPNTRGTIKVNTNHFPVQNFYLREVVKSADGSYSTQTKGIVFTNYGDAYAKDCKMKM